MPSMYIRNRNEVFENFEANSQLDKLSTYNILKVILYNYRFAHPTVYIVI